MRISRRRLGVALVLIVLAGGTALCAVCPSPGMRAGQVGSRFSSRRGSSRVWPGWLPASLSGPAVQHPLKDATSHLPDQHAQDRLDQGVATMVQMG